MRFIRVILAFLLTLLLFWLSPGLLENNNQVEFLDATAQNLLVDHTVLCHHSGADDPELSARVTTPLDTSAFRLLVYYSSSDSVARGVKLMSRQEGTLDLHTVTIPHLDISRYYVYHLELRDSADQLLIRLPEREGEEINLLFLGKTPTWLRVLYISSLSLATMLAWLALFDAVWLRSARIRLKKLSQKALVATIFLAIGGIITTAAISKSVYGFFWAGWPFGDYLPHTLWEITVFYWILLTSLFRGTIFGFRAQREIVSAGGATMLTLMGMILLVAVYLVGIDL